ncbi:unnamed protein product [Prunus armeniaca]
MLKVLTFTHQPPFHLLSKLTLSEKDHQQFGAVCGNRYKKLLSFFPSFSALRHPFHHHILAYHSAPYVPKPTWDLKAPICRRHVFAEATHLSDTLRNFSLKAAEYSNSPRISFCMACIARDKPPFQSRRKPTSQFQENTLTTNLEVAECLAVTLHGQGANHWSTLHGQGANHCSNMKATNVHFIISY